MLNDGGHPEILKKGGEVFTTFEECLKKLQIVKTNYEKYRKNIQIDSIEKIAEKYIRFIEKICLLKRNKKYEIKKLRLFDYYRLLFKNITSKDIPLKMISVNSHNIILNMKNRFLNHRKPKT